MNLVPKVGVGPFRLGSDLDERDISFVCTLRESDADGVWETYESDDLGVQVLCLSGLIYCIRAEKSCTFNGMELIGMSRGEITSVLGLTIESDSKIEINAAGYLIDFPTLGISLQLSNGRVTGVNVFEGS
jgi:hypothetical protein